MFVPKLKADLEHGEGEVFFPISFLRADHVIQLDLLSDWIADLSRQYNSLLSKNREAT